MCIWRIAGEEQNCEKPFAGQWSNLKLQPQQMSKYEKFKKGGICPRKLWKSREEWCNPAGRRVGSRGKPRCSLCSLSEESSSWLPGEAVSSTNTQIKGQVKSGSGFGCGSKACMQAPSSGESTQNWTKLGPSVRLQGFWIWTRTVKKNPWWG